jgi:RNA polymerase sigma factor (TIGR02999 family)
MAVAGQQSQEITRLLERWSQGDRSALDRLMPLVHEELRRMARQHLRAERPDHTLQATALVHEAYLRLAGGQQGFALQNRAHFFAVSAQIMRHVLVDHARAHAREKRGGGAQRVSLEENEIIAEEKNPDLLALDRALTTLEKVDARKARLVELRYFAGLTIEETAAVMGDSEMTVRREWRRAKAWLYRLLTEGDDGSGSGLAAG